ncbi:MAG: MmcQ/YjbR family DNA-binding protein [Candidatus Dormibacteria bacterium]
MPADPSLKRLRQLCLSLPEAVEDAHGVGNPSFKVSGRIFAMHMVNHHGDGETAFWCKVPPGGQEALTASQPETYFVPPYVGRFGWVGVRLDRPLDWAEVRDLVEDSYRLVAPRRLGRRLDSG